MGHGKLTISIDFKLACVWEIAMREDLQPAWVRIEIGKMGTYVDNTHGPSDAGTPAA
jgi:hypothetical protein